jgi:hypothetical protein
MGTHGTCGHPDSLNLGMSRRVMPGNHAVACTGDDFPLADDDSAKRPALFLNVVRCGLYCQFQEFSVFGIKFHTCFQTKVTVCKSKKRKWLRQLIQQTEDWLMPA